MRTPFPVLAARAILLLALNLNAACNRPAEPALQSRITAAQFVEVFVGLRQAQIKNRDTAAFEQAKREILRKAGVTEADLVQFVKAHANQPSLMAGVWDSVQARINRFEPSSQ